LLIGLVLAAGLAGGVAGRLLAPGAQPGARSPQRPIVQIVRQQPGLPSLADLIDGLCPSVGLIVAKGAAPGAASAAKSANVPEAAEVGAFAVSANGWLLTSADAAAGGHLDVIFGDGRRAAISEVRSDAVSGLALAKVDLQPLQPVPLSDQNAPRVGDFGFGLLTAGGNGCSAQAAMIGSDFLADGGGLASYVRLQTGPADLPNGTPFLGGDGRVVGISTGAAAGELVPAPLAAIIVDELIRNSPSPTTAFGFRAVDFAQALSARLGDSRARGAGVALVQPKSIADRAGLRAGDIIVSVNGTPVSSASELGRALDAVPRTAKLDVRRAAAQLELSVARTSH
jgi:serine protease DegQ